MPYFAAGMLVKLPSHVSSRLANNIFRGAFISGSLNEVLLGHRNVILISTLITLAASIGSAFATEWRSLLGLRALLGIAIGCKAVIVPAFAAEIAPAHLRGKLVDAEISKHVLT